MEEKKVSSEKDTDVIKKKRTTKKAAVKEEDNLAATVDSLMAEIAKLKEENARAKEEYERMLSLSAKVVSGMATPSYAKETVLVQCLELNGVELSSPNRDVIITLPYNTWVECDVDEMNQIFKKVSNRTLFEDGICIMEGDELERFRIKKKTTIDMDKIYDLLDEGNEQKIVAEFNSLTSDKKKSSVGHLILYSIVGKVLDGDLNRMPRSSVETIEQYFGVQLKNVETLLRIFREVKK